MYMYIINSMVKRIYSGVSIIINGTIELLEFFLNGRFNIELIKNNARFKVETTNTLLG